MSILPTSGADLVSKYDSEMARIPALLFSTTRRYVSASPGEPYADRDSVNLYRDQTIHYSYSLPHQSPHLFASSGCRFYRRFWTPFLVAFLHGLSECARLWGKTTDPPQRRRGRRERLCWTRFAKLIETAISKS